ncbi:hypothetical protein BGZ92_005403, partial [Podila epicladia]
YKILTQSSTLDKAFNLAQPQRGLEIHLQISQSNSRGRPFYRTRPISPDETLKSGHTMTQTSVHGPGMRRHGNESGS